MVIKVTEWLVSTTPIQRCLDDVQINQLAHHPPWTFVIRSMLFLFLFQKKWSESYTPLKTNPCSIGNTSSKSGFSILMLIFWGRQLIPGTLARRVWYVCKWYKPPHGSKLSFLRGPRKKIEAARQESLILVREEIPITIHYPKCSMYGLFTYMKDKQWVGNYSRRSIWVLMLI